MKLWHMPLVAVPMLLALTATTVAWASGLGLSTTHLGSSPLLVTPLMFPDAIATTSGNTVGKIEGNDKVTFTFSRVVNETTVCSGWTGQNATKSINVTWSIQNNAGATGNDVLAPSTVGATCATGIHLGSVDLGAPGYVSTNVQLSSCQTVLTLGTSMTSVSVTLTAPPKNTTAVVNQSSPAVWTADPLVADTSGNTIAASGANVAQTTTTVQF